MGTKITDLTSLAVAPDAADVVPIVDVSTGETKKITTALLVGTGSVPTSRTLTAGVGLTGGGDLTANRSFAVDIAGTSPQPIGTATPGASGKVSDRDHVHAHGNQAGGSLHALATKDADGFVAAADYDRVLGDSRENIPLWDTDFFEPVATFFGVSASGAGAALNQTASGAGSIVLPNAGTTATGSCAMRSAVNLLYNSVSSWTGCDITVVGGIWDVLPDGTDNYKSHMCLVCDSGFVTSQIGFVYDHTVGPNWRCVATVAGTPTYIDTGVAAVGVRTAQDLFTRFRMQIVGGGTGATATFWINGVQVGQFVGSLPSISAGYYVPCRIEKTLGTNVRRMVVDSTRGVAYPVAGLRA